MLRLTLKKADKASSNSDDSSSESPNSSPRRGWGVGRRCGRTLPGRANCPAVPFKAREWLVEGASPKSLGERREMCEQRREELTSLPKTRVDERHPHELMLTVRPYGHGRFVCDGCDGAGRRMSYHCVECKFDLHIDCEKAQQFAKGKEEGNHPWARRQRWFRLHNQAMKKIEKQRPKALEKARELLKEQVEISVFHRATPLYNLACVESLCGNQEEAVKYLREAVEAGWTDMAHLKADKDLANIRDFAGYKEFLVSVVNGNEKTEEESKEVAKVPELAKTDEKVEEAAQPKVDPPPPYATTAPMPPSSPVGVPAELHLVPDYAPSITREELNEPPVPTLSPVTPTPSPTPALSESKSAVAEFDEKLTTLEEMGWNDRRKNITTLVRTRGDLVAAVQMLLEEAGAY